MERRSRQEDVVAQALPGTSHLTQLPHSCAHLLSEVTDDVAGFRPNSLNTVTAIEKWPHVERTIGFALYVALNVIPASLGPLHVTWLLLRYWLHFVYLSHLAGLVLLAALGYILSLLAKNSREP